MIFEAREVTVCLPTVQTHMGLLSCVFEDVLFHMSRRDKAAIAVRAEVWEVPLVNLHMVTQVGFNSIHPGTLRTLMGRSF